MTDKLVGFNANPPPKKRVPASGVVAGITAILAIATPIIATWEGKSNTPYRDIVGVPTVCYGTTKGFENRRHTDAECMALLKRDMGEHLTPILACVPQLGERPKVTAAALSLSYNIGTSGFCKSTAAARFRARQWAQGCDAIARFNRAGGRVVQGLVNRRAAEVKLCKEGL